jgi:glycosyltransferase involved in cell wall biosynthesis
VPLAIDVVLPCLDEALALPWVLARMPDHTRAIVVDNGSSDGSAVIARKAGALVIDCAQRGYGAACAAGLDAATADVVAFCDCDGSIDPKDIPVLADRLAHGVDLVIGRRVPISRAAWSLPARIANRELARRIRKRTSLRIVDVGPVRVAKRQTFVSLDLRDRRSGYPVETLLRAAEAGLVVAQADVTYHERVGKSKVTGSLTGYLQAVRDMSAVLKQ